MFKTLYLHLCYRKVTDCDLCYGLFSFVFGMLRITVRILTKNDFYVYKSVCSKEPGESFTRIIKIPFCLKRRRNQLPTI